MTNPIYDGTLWAGSIWYSGTATPAVGLGVNGDFYLKTATDEIFKKEAGSWNLLVDLTGSQGVKGDTGAGTPIGGNNRQILSKTSNSDYATGWRSIDSQDVSTALGFVPVAPNTVTLQSVTNQGNLTSNAITITNTTPSTNTTTGSLTVGGGLGVYGTVNADIVRANSFVGNLTGNASTVTNGVVSSGSYVNPTWIAALTWSKITNIPYAGVGSGGLLGAVRVDGSSILVDANGVLSANLTSYSTTSQMNTAISTAVSTAVSNLVNSAPSTLDTLNELATALGNDASFSTTITNSIASKAPINSPSFTGTVTGITKAMVGLGNVDNTSDANKPVSTATQTALDLKAPLASPTLTGTVTLPLLTEAVNTLTNATGVVTHDVSSGSIFYHTTPTANFTANFTNVPTTNNRTVVVTLIVVQGVTAYIPSAVQIGGSAQVIKWIGGSVPSGNANKIDIFSFTLIRTNNLWAQALGSLNSYG